MATLSKEDIADMDERERGEYCYRCWFRGYGNCSQCALLYKNTPNKACTRQVESSASQSDSTPEDLPAPEVLSQLAPAGNANRWAASLHNKRPATFERAFAEASRVMEIVYHG
jgi:hypothetical protein